VLDLARRLTSRTFLAPTAGTPPEPARAALVCATAALSGGVGFLPVSGPAAGLRTVAAGAAVSVLRRPAGCWRALDAGRITSRTGLAAGPLITAAGLGSAMLPGLLGVLTGAVLIGAGTGLITPLGFAALAAPHPPNASARPWDRLNSAANSAMPAARRWSRRSPPSPPSPTAPRPWRYSWLPVPSSRSPHTAAQHPPCGNHQGPVATLRRGGPQYAHPKIAGQPQLDRPGCCPPA
jgi:hypothetical protein